MKEKGYIRKRMSISSPLSNNNKNKEKNCLLGISFGEESSLYSFPNEHPLNNKRTELFATSLQRFGASSKSAFIVKPIEAKTEDLLLFHDQEYVDFVRASSKAGEGYLDYGDTPSFKGVFEASLFPVGNTLQGFKMILEGKFDHFFNPIGGLHHAKRESAGGFCVFNDAAIVIEKALKDTKLEKVAYVDIDAHHGDGVFYGFESDRRVIIGDIHEDGRYLYPGTGYAYETGKGNAVGTKLNIPLAPASGDREFFESFDKIESFIRKYSPEFIFLQCGADCLDGDPITHLRYSSKAHSYATERLHILSHEVCNGRLLAMGGGGYNPRNVEAAWMAVVTRLSDFQDVSS
jgi:acetoin utilization protein AcuC